MSLYNIIITYILPVIIPVDKISENALTMLSDFCVLATILICLEFFLFIPFRLLKKVCHLK